MTAEGAPLYHSPTLRVQMTLADAAAFAARGADLVTFEPILRAAGREPFGAQFARKYGINALHIVPVGSDWYQYPDLGACLAIVASHTAPGATIYGSSMGAFAATTYADVFHDAKVIALSPQISIRPQIVPFETRWLKDAARIAFLPDEERVAERTPLYILFDPRNPDAIHARMIARAVPATAILVPVPYGGHPVGPTLVEAGSLSGVIRAIMRGSPTAEEVAALFLPNLDQSASYHLQIAQQRPHAERIAHIERGLVLKPRHVKLRYAKVNWLIAEGRDEAALEELRWVLARRPEHQTYRLQYARICRRLGIAPDPALLPAAGAAVADDA
jgi:hypothetical protein